MEMYNRYTSDRTDNEITERLVGIRDFAEMGRSDRADLADACNRIHEQRNDIDRLSTLLLSIYPEVVKSRDALADGLGYDANTDDPTPPEVGRLTDWLCDMAMATTTQTLAESHQRLKALAIEVGLIPTPPKHDEPSNGGQ